MRFTNFKRLVSWLGLWHALIYVVRILGRRHQLLVLTYHHISDSPDETRMLSGLETGIHVRTLDAQLGEVCKWYRPMSMTDFVEIATGKRPLRDSAFVVTFDDAYASVQSLALPILRKWNVLPHVFVATGYIESDRRFWWVRWVEFMRRVTPEQWSELATLSDPCPMTVRRVFELHTLNSWTERRTASQAMLAALDTLQSDERTRLLETWQEKVPAPRLSDLPLLRWTELQRLVHEGATIGGHTHSHDRLGSLSPSAVAADLEESAATFRAHGMDIPNTFAYPSGDFNTETAAVVASAGYRLAFTTQHGFLDGKAPDAYHIPRTSLGNRTGPELLARIALMQVQQFLPIRLRKRPNLEKSL